MTTLSVWTDGNSWVVASSAADALARTGQHEDDSPLGSWEALPPEEDLAFVMEDDGPLMLPTRPYEIAKSGFGMRKQQATCAEWVEAVTSGQLEPYLGSMDW